MSYRNQQNSADLELPNNLWGNIDFVYAMSCQKQMVTCCSQLAGGI